MNSSKSNESNQLFCQKHNQKYIRFICCFDGCNFGNLICDTCLTNDPRHMQQHKSYVSDTNHFFATQTKMTQKLLPSIAESVQDIDKNFKEYNQHCDSEVAEIDKDFAEIFKTFFNISEAAKNFLKDQIRTEGKKFQPRLQDLQNKLQELNQTKKKDSNIFNMIFSRDNDEVTASSQEELVAKLIKKNGPLNLIRAESFALSQELSQIKSKKVSYKHLDESKKLFEQIKDAFESQTKDMYRKFKALLEGADNEDLRQSIFAGIKSTVSLSNSMILSKKASIVSIDLSSSSSSNPLKRSITLTSEDNEKKPARQLKKVAQFPSLSNKNVLEAIRINGSFNYRIEDSYLNNQPEQGPFEFEDGSIYYGHIQDSKRNGRGKQMFQDGAYYEGFWKDDIPFGMGRIIRNNGDVYQGQINNFKAHGKGVFKTLKGEYMYNGDWLEDLKHGKGDEVIQGKYLFSGDFLYGKKHGNGEIKFVDGTIYVGEFKEGEITGEGQFIYPNGEKYVGCVKDGQKYGKGSYVWPDGRNYDGTYMNNLPHGKGMFIWPDGYIYNGNWVNGVQHGQGLEIDPEGNEKEGVWENGVWKNWV
ncbi:hypothetical protein ABPG74_007067 [Tetrahymena malaccensis]